MENPKAYLGNDKYIFLSYSHQNKDIVYKLISILQTRYNVWFDEGIHLSAEWDDEITRKIDGCSLFMFAITKESLQSQNCRDELAYARDEGKEFLNILMEDIELPKNIKLRFGRYQMFKYFEYKNKDDILIDLDRRSDVIKLAECKESKEVSTTPTPVSDFPLPVYLFDEHDIDNLKEESQKLTINGMLMQNKINANCIAYTSFSYFTKYIIQMNSKDVFKDIEVVIPHIFKTLNNVSVTLEKTIRENNLIFINIANVPHKPVYLSDVYDELRDKALEIPLGENSEGTFVSKDIEEFQHLFINGATGSGKSLFLHSIIATLIMRNSPDDLKLLLVDPKRVEFSKYKEIPHLLRPVLNGPIETGVTFIKLKEEMEQRLKKIHQLRCHDISEFNDYASKHNLKTMSKIVVVVDDYSAIAERFKNINSVVGELLFNANAAGIYLIFASQNISADIINRRLINRFGSRASFLSYTTDDSNALLGVPDAKYLLGNGEMLIKTTSDDNVIRVQTPLVLGKDINNICNYLRENYTTIYEDHFVDEFFESVDDIKSVLGPQEETDPEILKYQLIKEWVMGQEYMSISKMQRECGIGFNRAVQYFRKLIDEGVIEEVASGTSKGNRVIKRL